MPSYLPILSYSSSLQDENAVESTSGAAEAGSFGSEKGTVPTRSGEDKVLSSPTTKSVDVGLRNELVIKKGGKKAMRKKKPSAADRAAKGASNRDVSASAGSASSDKLDQVKVEKLVTKAKSHAHTVQAVKMAVYDIQLALLDGVRSEAQLESSRALLTQGEYHDVVVERSIERKCGYPLCDKPLLSESQRKGRFRISVSEHKIYDVRETGLFCSQTCLIASKTFAISLKVERDGLIQQEKLAAVIRAVRDCKAFGSRKTELNPTDQQTDRATNSLLSEVKERQDTEIAGFEDAGPSDAIEGYTPVTSVGDSRFREGNFTYSIMDDISSCVKSTYSSESSPEKGKSALMPAAGKKSGMVRDVPAPKSILKKSQSEMTVKRSVSWGDQKNKGDQIHRAESKVKLKTGPKARRQVREMPQPLKRATTGNASTGGDVSVASSVRETDEAESARYLAEAKAGLVQLTERLSLTESPVSPTKETVFAEGKKSSLAKSADSDFASIQSSSSMEHPTGRTGLMSISDGQTSLSNVNSDSRKPVTSAEAQLAERLASAEDVAAALIEAAEETAAGDFESAEAVARAGLFILSVNETSKNSVSTNSLEEASIEEEKPTRVGLKWPQVDPQEEDEEQVCSSKAGWHDTAPKSFKLEISMFGTIWMALEEWISAATIAFIYGKEASNEDDFLYVNGREYRLQVICGDGVSAGISRAFSDSVSRVLPDVVQALGLRVPLSIIEHALGRMVRTMSFVEPLPALAVNHWRMLVMLFLEGLSVDQMDSVGVHLSKHSSLFRNLLIATGTSGAEYNSFRSLLLPSGLLPSVSLSGG